GFGFTGGRVGPIFGTGGQANEVFNGLRGVVAEQFDDDVAAVGFDDSFVCSNTHERYSSIIDCVHPVLSQRKFEMLRGQPKELLNIAVRSWQPGARARNLVVVNPYYGGNYVGTFEVQSTNAGRYRL